MAEKKFNFSKENIAKAKAVIKKYPGGKQKSAILPLLDLAQRQNDGWLSTSAMECVSDMLEVPYMRTYEVASFYSMFNLKPVGKHHVQICGTTPCWLRGSDDIKKACEDHMKIKCGETTKDGKYTLTEVECLGACRNAPLVQINDDYYEDLDGEKMREILKGL